MRAYSTMVIRLSLVVANQPRWNRCMSNLATGRTLVLLPGMGVDASMYAGPWRTLPNTRFVDWPSYAGERSVGEQAERVIDEYDLTSDQEIGGTSLGGMVALEIARRLGQRRVLLLSSATSPAEIRVWLRMLSPLAPITPFEFGLAILKRLRGTILQRLRASAKFLQRADPKFLRAMCTAIVRWEGCAEPSGGTVRIHGNRDWMIRCPATARKIPGAGHLAVITHAAECVEQVRRWWSGESSVSM